MSLFSVPVILRNPAAANRQTELSLLVDTGSLFTWVAATALEQIGVVRVETCQFRTIDGSLIEHPIGYVVVAYDGRSGAMNVVFAQPGDMEVLGITALETLRMTADPIRRVLVPTVALAV